MDARRYDRNADQLAQIFWHFTKLQKQKQPVEDPAITRMLGLLEECLKLNDDLGKLAEKGLI
jgi:hypothetical protein